MTRSFLIANGLLAAWLMQVAAFAQTRVSHDSRPTTNFAQVRSFAVQPGELSDSQLVNERILNAIADSLAVRGMTRSPEQPDVYIIPRLTSEIRQEVTGYGPGWYEPYGAFGVSRWYGPFGWDRWGGPEYTIRDRRYDTLTIDMVDATTGSLLWRGQGVRSVSLHWDSHELDEKVRKTVAKIFKHYPYGDDR